MTSISPINYQQQSPLSLLQNELTSEVSSGTISASDQSALGSALTDINSALQSNTSSSPPSPSDMKSKIDSLISQEVQNGKLTSNQATELQNVFSSAFSKGGPGGPGGLLRAVQVARPARPAQAAATAAVAIVRAA